MKRPVTLFFAAILTFLHFWSCTEKEQDVPVASITISQPAAEMIIGESITLKATISPSNATEREIMWASSKQSVATVDQSGKVVAVAEGSSTITASAGGKMGACVVTVSKGFVKITSITLDKTSVSLTVGETETLTATVRPNDATDKSVTWSTTDASVATVKNGVVTAVKAGTATITVTTNDQEKSASCAITVTQLVTSISLNKASLTLNEGEEETLTPTVKPDNADDKSLTWTSSDSSVAAVDENGKVTAVSKGFATIKAETKDGSGKSATCDVTVKRLVASIEFDKASITMYRGSSDVTETLSPTVLPVDASNTNIQWTSSNTSVATVSNGVVTGKAPGTTIITALAEDGSGINATCDVEVKQYATEITLSQTSLFMAEGENQSLTITITPDNATDKTVTWSSSDNAVAAVDANGRVTAVSRGRATVSVAATDGSGVSASCSVYVSPVGSVDLGLNNYFGKIVYWATCNLGASAPEEYGDYYAWGETETKDEYSWETYKWCNGSYNSITKYNTMDSFGTVDNKTQLEAEDDVAHVKLGGKWRMATQGEWLALRENCTWTWSHQNGIRGCLVTSNINGASIFLPAAGWRRDNLLYDAASLVMFGSSSLNTRCPDTMCTMYLQINVVISSTDSRSYGYTVRPVSE